MSRRRDTTKVFVGHVPKGVTDDELRREFEKYGEVVECDIVKNFAFVHYTNERDAEMACEAMNEMDFRGANLRVEISKKAPGSGGRNDYGGGRGGGRGSFSGGRGGYSRGGGGGYGGGRMKGSDWGSGTSTKLFVGNLPESCSKRELQEKFEEFGEVVECDIVKNYAFVHFSSPEEAESAAAGLHLTQFLGSEIRVEISKSRMRQKPGMDRDVCYRCGDPDHWSKNCPTHPDNTGGGDGGGRGGRGGERNGRSEPYPRDPYRRDPIDRDPYPRDPYARPPYDPYTRDPYARDPYYDYYRGRYPPPPRDRYPYPDPYERRPLPEDPYARLPPTDPYARLPPSDPYARPPADPYTRPADPYARPDPYAREKDPYARSTDPYARPAAPASSDPYARSTSSSTDPYARPAASTTDPYARTTASTSDPYARPAVTNSDPYARPAANTSVDPYARSAATDPYARGVSDPYARQAPAYGKKENSVGGDMMSDSYFPGRSRAKDPYAQVETNGMKSFY